MKRENRPELGDAQLLAYLDGEAETEVVEHVEQCVQCSERARQLARLQGRLTARFYRLVCPSSTDLGEYHLGLLAQEQAGAVGRHLAECPHCTREVAQLRSYLDALAPDVEFNPLERARILVAELVRGIQDLGSSPAFAPSPAFAGLRGDEEGGPLVYQAEEYQVAVEIERDAQRQDRFNLLVLVSGGDASGLEAQLWQEDLLVAAAAVDELGNSYISDLAPGSYELLLSGPEVEVRIPELQIGEP